MVKKKRWTVHARTVFVFCDTTHLKMYCKKIKTPVAVKEICFNEKNSFSANNRNAGIRDGAKIGAGPRLSKARAGRQSCKYYGNDRSPHNHSLWSSERNYTRSMVIFIIFRKSS